MPSPGMGAIGSLDYTKEERQKLARRSLEFECSDCGKIVSLLQEPSQSTENEAVQAEARELGAQVIMKGENNPDAAPQAPSQAEPPAPVPEQQIQERPSGNPADSYNYIIAAIVVAIAILLYRRFYLTVLT